jgi:large subunit ribosomal protein L22
MEITAKLNKLRIAPRKMRLLADLIRGKEAQRARALLALDLKRGALPLRKLLDSAIANAKNNFHLDEKSLVIYKIMVDEGVKLKRWRARARGRANRIEKKTSHITIVLKEQGGVKALETKGGEIAKQPKKEKTPKTLIEKKKTGLMQKDTIKIKSRAASTKTFRRKSI